MADGRDIGVWDNHAQQCREAERKPFTFEKDHWWRVKLKQTKAKRVLDLGCGPGYWAGLFAGCDYTGVDQSGEMLRLAQENWPKKKFVLSNGRVLSSIFPSNSFDLVFTAAVLQHNRYSDKHEIMSEVKKIIHPRGYLLCTENTFRADNYPQSIDNPDCTDGYSYTPIGWEKFMGSCGFSLVEYSAPSEYLFQKTP